MSLEQRLRAGEITEEEAARIDMEAFDRLPPAFRDLIRHGAVEIPATVAQEYITVYGPLALGALKQAVNTAIKENAAALAKGSKGY